MSKAKATWQYFRRTPFCASCYSWIAKSKAILVPYWSGFYISFTSWCLQLSFFSNILVFLFFDFNFLLEIVVFAIHSPEVINYTWLFNPPKVRRYPYGVMVKALDGGIVVSKFELQSHYYVHFRTNTLRYEPPYPPIYELNSITTVLLEG